MLTLYPCSFHYEQVLKLVPLDSNWEVRDAHAGLIKLWWNLKRRIRADFLHVTDKTYRLINHFKDGIVS